MRTLRAFTDAGHDLRVWCYACQGTRVIDARALLERMEQRGEPGDIGWIAERLRCRECGGNGDLLLIPARRPPPPPAPPPPRVLTWEQEVVAFFHANRAEAKALRRRR